MPRLSFFSFLFFLRCGVRLPLLWRRFLLVRLLWRRSLRLLEELLVLLEHGPPAGAAHGAEPAALKLAGGEHVAGTVSERLEAQLEARSYALVRVGAEALDELKRSGEAVMKAYQKTPEGRADADVKARGEQKTNTLLSSLSSLAQGLTGS